MPPGFHSAGRKLRPSETVQPARRVEKRSAFCRTSRRPNTTVPTVLFEREAGRGRESRPFVELGLKETREFGTAAADGFHAQSQKPFLYLAQRERAVDVVVERGNDLARRPRKNR